jgi:hypothetical protein
MVLDAGITSPISITVSLPVHRQRDLGARGVEAEPFAIGNVEGALPTQAREGVEQAIDGKLVGPRLERATMRHGRSPLPAGAAPVGAGSFGLASRSKRTVLPSRSTAIAVTSSTSDRRGASSPCACRSSVDGTSRRRTR